MRFSWVMIALLGCSEAPPRPLVESVSPNDWQVGTPVTLTITGERFEPLLVTDMQEGGVRVRGFTIHLEGPLTTELEDVRVVDREHLTADVAPLLPVGTYDVVVTDPWSRPHTLGGAIMVLPVGSAVCATDQQCEVNGCSLPGACAGGVCTQLGCGDCWWDAGWWRRRRLTITNPGGPLSDVPIMVAIESPDVDTSATLPDGADIRFTLSGDECGIQAAHEISVWAPAGRSLAWVRVPALPSGNTSLYLYYDNIAAEPPQTSATVWAPDHVGVWHLEEEPTELMRDSSASGKHGTPSSLTPSDRMSCRHGHCYRFDGLEDHIRIPSSDVDVLSLAEVVTLEAWIHRRGNWTGTYQAVVARRFGDSWGDSYAMYIHNEGPAMLSARLSGAGTEFITSPPGTINATDWHYFVATRHMSGDAYLYLDGQEVAYAFRPLLIDVDDNDVTIGGQENSADDSISELFRGEIDEVRISRTSRSAEWVQMQYRSMTGQAVSFGEEDRR